MTEHIETIIFGLVFFCFLIWWINLTLELLFDVSLFQLLLGTVIVLLYVVQGFLYVVHGLALLVSWLLREREPEPCEDLNDDWLRANHPELYEKENEAWLRANDPEYNG